MLDNPKAQSNKKQKAPGIFFDSKQGRVTQPPIKATEKNQKLYSPYEYLQYTSKINLSKNQYLNSLNQLGYECNKLEDKKLQQILKNTDNLIKNTYSIKYIGVIDENMGILSKRQQMTSMNQKRNLIAVEDLQKYTEKKGYIVDSYSIPNQLKSVKTTRDQEQIYKKQQVEAWRQSQIQQNLQIQQRNKDKVIKGKTLMKKKSMKQQPKNLNSGIIAATIDRKYNNIVSYSSLLKNIENQNRKDHLQDNNQPELHQRLQKLQTKTFQVE